MASRTPRMSMGISHHQKTSNRKEMATSLNLTEEKCEQTITRIAAYQQQFRSSYNKRAKIRQFQPRDLVLRPSSLPAEKAPKRLISSGKVCTRSAKKAARVIIPSPP
ncbi:hypothetical protein ACFX2I_002876 [Malus domestica]